MRWMMLLAAAAAGCATAQAEQPHEARCGLPICHSFREDTSQVLVTCEQRCSPGLPPDFGRMVFMVYEQAAQQALAVGKPYVQEMGSGNGEATAAGWRIVHRFELLRDDEAAPRMAAPEKVRPMSATIMLDTATRQLAGR